MKTLQDEIRAVLHSAGRGKPNASIRGLLTAYQILHLLPRATRDALISKDASAGTNAGADVSAASAIARAIGSMGAEVRVDYLDTRHLGVAAGDTEAGNPMCGVYRLKEYDSPTA
jgi:hypothetical protein